MVFIRWLYSDPQTNNYWPPMTQKMMYGLATLCQATSLYTLSVPNYPIVNMAGELVETSVDKDDGTFTLFQLEKAICGVMEILSQLMTGHSHMILQSLSPAYASIFVQRRRNSRTSTSGTYDDYTVSITFNYDPGLSTWQYGTAQAPALSKAYWEAYASDKETLYAHDKSMLL